MIRKTNEFHSMRCELHLYAVVLKRSGKEELAAIFATSFREEIQQFYQQTEVEISEEEFGSNSSKTNLLDQKTGNLPEQPSKSDD